MLAWNYGQPEVYASFAFPSSDTAASPPSDANGMVTDTNCTDGTWACVDRSVAGLVGFHNYTYGTNVSHWYDDGVNLISFSRGAKGWITINNETTAQTHTFSTGLPRGHVLRRRPRQEVGQHLHRRFRDGERQRTGHGHGRVLRRRRHRRGQQDQLNVGSLSPVPVAGAGAGLAPSVHEAFGRGVPDDDLAAQRRQPPTLGIGQAGNERLDLHPNLLGHDRDQPTTRRGHGDPDRGRPRQSICARPGRASRPGRPAR